jgi:NAD-dependent SIR2 family protein deacetylase
VAAQDVALIVGAGFSTEAGLPTTPQLGQRFLEIPPTRRPADIDQRLREEIDRTITKVLSNFWKGAFQFRSNDHHPSLEDHFTVIDLAANTGHHLGPDFSPRRLRLIRRFSIHRAFQILDTSFKPSPAIERLLRDLMGVGTLSVVCINWDIVLEKHFTAMNMHYDYGSSVRPLDPGLRGSEQGGIPLFKMHGSTNWVYCDSCRTLFAGSPEEGKSALHRSVFLEAEDFRFLRKRKLAKKLSQIRRQERECPGCGCILTARVGTFSFRKDFVIQQFQTIWQQAHSALRDSDTWLFVGYSMPEADFEFRHLLKSAELANRERRREKHIQVILKDDCDAARRFRRFFGLTHDHINQDGLATWVGRSLRAWVTTTRSRQ